MSTPSLFIIIIVLLHCSNTGRLESSWGSCCERCCTSTSQEPVTASKSFLICIMKANSIWEWKQANGDTGACPRSRLGGNPGFQHPCPGPDSRLAQTFPLCPFSYLPCSAFCCCMDLSSVPSLACRSIFWGATSSTAIPEPQSFISELQRKGSSGSAAAVLSPEPHREQLLEPAASGG